MDKWTMTGSPVPLRTFPARLRVLSATPSAIDRPQASGLAKQAEGAAQDLYGQAKDVARDAAGAAANYARQFQDETLVEIVREYPIRALWIAGGIGFALALMLRRPPR
jgi:hypothetical protein